MASLLGVNEVSFRGLGRVYLDRFVPFGFDAAVEFGGCGSSIDTGSLGDAFEGLATSGAWATAFGFSTGVSVYFAKSSPIFAFRRAFGIRFKRSSIRVRRLWACKEYCARNFRARSVTGTWSMLHSRFKVVDEVHLLAANYQ